VIPSWCLIKGAQADLSPGSRIGNSAVLRSIGLIASAFGLS
jgi:hypothetical protein